MHVFKNEFDWFVAEDIDAAYDAYCKHMGRTKEELVDEDDLFTQVDDDTRIKIWADEKGVTSDPCEEGGVTLQERTAGEWARLNGPGLLASTEY